MKFKITRKISFLIAAILITIVCISAYLVYLNLPNKVSQHLSLEEDGQYVVNKKNLNYDNEVFVSETYPEITNLSDLSIQNKFNTDNDFSNTFQKDIESLRSGTEEINRFRAVSSPICKYSLQNGFEVVLKNKRYLSIENNTYRFSCGAHGNGGSFGEVYDLQEGKKLELKDLFKTKDYLETIYKIVRSRLCLNPKIPNEFGSVCESTEKLYSKEDTEDWFLKGTMPKDANYSAFYITKTGVTFIFSQYQIASYAEGQFKVEVTYDELKDIINLDFGQK